MRATSNFPTDPSGLPHAEKSRVLELKDGAAIDLRVAPVAKQLGESTVRMLAFGGSVPGPTLRVDQGSSVEVTVVNDGDLETTVHWHGLRLSSAYDGTTLTQAPIAVGEAFVYRLEFPDPGVYWYHPHIREDYGQELGLYGAIIVTPSDAEYWPPVDRELTLCLDDILLVDGRVAPFDRAHSTHTAMGRFGNVFLVNGEPDPVLPARTGEVVRLYVINTANTRVFNVRIPNARMKLVGGDSGRCEHEELVESVVVAPSERAVVDVLFHEVGSLPLEHLTPSRTYAIATVEVGDGPEGRLAAAFAELRTNADMAAERRRIERELSAEPDKILSFVAEMDMGEPAARPGAALAYVCPMHADVTSSLPGTCPKCGMKLMLMAVAHPSSSEEHVHHGDFDASRGDSGGVEWEDEMVELNRMTTPQNMRWKLVDRSTGAEGSAIDWSFRVGERVKIRVINEIESDHPMHHPFHIHGAGRFLVLSRDGAVEPNLVWKDTVLVPTGATIDLLLDVTHPGRWMAHCHIAEHHEGGMMLPFTVTP